MIARFDVVLGTVGVTTLLLGPATPSVALGVAGFALSKAVFHPVMQPI